MSGRNCILRTVITLVAVACFAVGLFGQTSVEELNVTIGKSIVIDYPSKIGRISTSDPGVVDAVAVSTREILLNAKSYGTATVVVWAKNGQRNFYNISVQHNIGPIRDILKATFPGEDIHVQSARDSVTLTGKVSSQEISDRAAALTASLAKTVVNNLQLVENVQKQILLRVKFAEMDRNIGSQFAVNLLSTGALNTHGIVTTGQFPSVKPRRVPGDGNQQSQTFTLSDALNIFAFRPDLNLGAFVAAMQSEGLLQILAEPNLITSNGKEASFLVGGEFPVPILQGGSNSGAVTVQFKEFGIRLNFTPVLTPKDTIRMYVKPEVSTIDLANSVQFNGFTIPALATRRMETDIELREGQSFVIGGLMDQRAQATFSRIPGLSHIPILGELFKSRDKKKSKSELIVMVTPEIVEPLDATDVKPVPVMPLKFLRPIHPDDEVRYDGTIRKKKP